MYPHKSLPLNSDWITAVINLVTYVIPARSYQRYGKSHLPVDISTFHPATCKKMAIASDWCVEPFFLVILSDIIMTPPYSGVSSVLGRVAWKIYETMWRKDPGKIPLDVPCCNGLKYIPRTQINELQLPSLGFIEDVLLVREEYLIAWDALNRKSNGGGGIVITGQPGINAKFLHVMPWSFLLILA